MGRCNSSRIRSTRDGCEIETRDSGLARQHRFVIKDNLMHYDVFSVFEDDMRITGGHIHHYLTFSRELERLAEEAPDTLPAEVENPHKCRISTGSFRRSSSR